MKAGAPSEQHLCQLRGLLARATLVPTTPADYDSAAHTSLRVHSAATG